jgi:predicted nucleic acid-binding protein
LIIVVDASAMVAALTDPGQEGSEIVSTVIASDLVAPHFIDLEVAQALRRYERQGHSGAAAALRRFRLGAIRRFEHGAFLPRIWELRHNLTAYDAAYVALAEKTGFPLVTADRKLANTPGHGATIIGP